MAGNILVTYGSFTFDSINQPNPGVSISRNGERSPGNYDTLFTPLEVTLEGNIITSGFQPVVSGIRAIEDAFSPELGCQAFKIQCDSNTHLLIVLVLLLILVSSLEMMQIYLHKMVLILLL